jgi:hypothetical protein
MINAGLATFFMEILLGPQPELSWHLADDNLSGCRREELHSVDIFVILCRAHRSRLGLLLGCLKKYQRRTCWHTRQASHRMP